MKVNYKDFRSAVERKSDSLSYILLHGSYQSEIKEKCDEAAELLCGPTGHEEMRINKLSESSLLKEPDKLQNIIKTISFFPGKQVIIIEGATDKISKTLENSLKNWTSQDAIIILMSNAIKPTSSLRKMGESNPLCISTAVYDEQRNVDKINKTLNSAKIQITNVSISNFLKNPTNFSSMQSFILFIEKLEAYKFSDQSPVTFEDIDLLLTEQHSLDEFEMLTLLARGDVKNMIQLLKKLFTSGIKPNKIVYSANKHFVLLHKISLNRHNPDLVLNKNYPPLFGDRRNQVISQSKIWSTPMIERALEIIMQLELRMRTGSHVGLTSLLERSFLRIASLVKQIS